MATMVRAYPPDDESFQAQVAYAIDVVQSQCSRDAEDFVERIEGMVKRAYPNARVAQMDPLAQAGFFGPVWYAYRDGALRPTTRSKERATATVGSTR